MTLILTCEHGGCDIPTDYKEYFKNKNVLKTHRAYDLGALDLFHYLEPLSDASFSSTTSRLFIELNRSLHHKHLFSEFTKGLSKNEKINIVEAHYLPYRNAVEKHIKNVIDNKNSVLHLSIHSFTPELNNKVRNCDIGLLYDPKNLAEKDYCKQLKIKLVKLNPNLNVRYNYPYLGKSDGYTTYLRTQFPTQYIGIEIEVNQKFASKNNMNFEIKQNLHKAIELLKA